MDHLGDLPNNRTITGTKAWTDTETNSRTITLGVAEETSVSAGLNVEFGATPFGQVKDEGSVTHSTQKSRAVATQHGTLNAATLSTAISSQYQMAVPPMTRGRFLIQLRCQRSQGRLTHYVDEEPRDGAVERVEVDVAYINYGDVDMAVISRVEALPVPTP